MRAIVLKGADLAAVWPERWPMGLFVLGAGALALKRYRQTLD